MTLLFTRIFIKEFIKANSGNIDMINFKINSSCLYVVMWYVNPTPKPSYINRKYLNPIT